MKSSWENFGQQTHGHLPALFIKRILERERRRPTNVLRCSSTNTPWRKLIAVSGMSSLSRSDKIDAFSLTGEEMPRLTSQGERGERGAVSANVLWKVSSFERCQRSRRRCISLAALEDTEEEGYCGYRNRIPRRAFFVAPFAGCHSAGAPCKMGFSTCVARERRSSDESVSDIAAVAAGVPRAAIFLVHPSLYPYLCTLAIVFRMLGTIYFCN